MDIQKRFINELIIDTYNPRKDLKPEDKEYQDIKNSILKFGFVEPLVINSDYTVIGGHQRIKVLQELGYDEIECVAVSVNKLDEKALNITLNKVGGSWDPPKLADLFKILQIAEYDISITGFEVAEIEQIMAQFSNIQDDNFDVDQAIKDIEEPITKPGDIWTLGRHRLMCGDSTILDNITKLMNKSKANMCLTDPPYNVDYEGGTKDKLKIVNDKMSSEKFYSFLLAAFKNIFEALDDGCAAYIFHGDTEGLNFRKAFVDAGFHLQNVCIWVKNSLVMGRCDYHWQHEPILYGWKPTAAHKWYSNRKQTTKWEFNRPMSNKEHPTMKPVEICAYPINNSSMSNCIVLDPFGGSGSTLIAAEQTNRICYMMELDPKYVEVIVQRWEKHTGKKAVRLDGDEE